MAASDILAKAEDKHARATSDSAEASAELDTAKEALAEIRRAREQWSKGISEDKETARATEQLEQARKEQKEEERTKC
eukprot:4174093-Heterocapsa_arctica.AAC.1